MKILGNKVIFSIFILCSILFGQNQCNGSIKGLSDFGVHIELKNQLKEQCWIEENPHSYYIKRYKDSIFIKLAPPTFSIEGDSSKNKFVSKPRGGLKTKKLESEDFLNLNWKGLKTDSSFVIKNGKRLYIAAYDFYFPKGATYEPFTYVKKGEHLILDIPCLDEKTAKRAPPFHITKTQYPFLRCIIAPAKKDYYGE